MNLSRPMVLQALLDIFDEPAYLEIGVFDGATFTPLRAALKTAVDPKFQFDSTSKSLQSNARYYEVTSDDYFSAIWGGTREFDVIYLDGLHTFDQTLRDLINSLGALKADGVIVVDDILPRNYQASLPDHALMARISEFVGSTDPAWMGDTYKLTFFVESFMPELSFRTIADNHGQLVLWRKRRDLRQTRSLEQISSMPYHQFVDEIAALRLTPFTEIVAEIRRGRTAC